MNPIVCEFKDKIGQVITQRLIPGGYTMNGQAILYVTLCDGRRLYHTRKGLSEQLGRATKFKSINHGLRVARARYKQQLGQLATSYTVTDLEWATENKQI